jgi:hypothetical protein
MGATRAAKTRRRDAKPLLNSTATTEGAPRGPNPPSIRDRSHLDSRVRDPAHRYPSGREHSPCGRVEDFRYLTSLRVLTPRCPEHERGLKDRDAEHYDGSGSPSTASQTSCSTWNRRGRPRGFPRPRRSAALRLPCISFGCVQWIPSTSGQARRWRVGPHTGATWGNESLRGSTERLPRLSPSSIPQGDPAK